MIKITLKYGIHEKSAFGFVTYALAYATVFKNMSEGYKLGKYALALTAKKNFISRNIPEVYSMVYGGVNIWKEPIQAVLPEIMNGYTIGMEVSMISFKSPFLIHYQMRESHFLMLCIFAPAVWECEFFIDEFDALRLSSLPVWYKTRYHE